jgi:hypothetical protein
VTYRSDLDALDARHSALTHELGAKTRELDDATRLLEQARARAKLPILDNIRVASPCTADWTQMTGDERTRHCTKCEKQVFNLSEMTRAEAEALILEKHGDLCARYYRRHDGTIITSDCRIGVVASRKRKLIAAGALALLGTGGGVAIQRHNRIELDGIDNIEAPAPREATTTHVAANAKNDAPPPKPIEPEIIEVHGETVPIEPPTLVMGGISSSVVEIEPLPPPVTVLTK